MMFKSRRKSQPQPPMFYVETLNMFGHWVPCRLPEKPAVQGGKLVRASSLGPIIRPMEDGYSIRIPDDLSHLTLGQLRERIGPDGRFTAGQKAAVGAAE